jgi:hypothetical protein
MKYIITEQQGERIKESIMSYLDSHLTPFDGWETPKEYKKNLIEEDEIFLFIVDSDGYGDDPHMWYSLHTNTHSDVPKEISPLITLPSAAYDALDGFFGNLWKPFFKEWFKKNTGLRLKTIEKQDW